ncbi:hypothetical protein CGCS363_v003324 [Colletotrichum siamense]|uniref:uncharacterized protein n=1 Tax=Colletotrichum siamense TaxID=690259 RepID=UPI00187260FF|nr:uncharacterized protein CGCS363_v003324 [Colletotrichum siamense]KAF5511509.1 hypothetical protein CGCS363_v003324 [Colletotrichum siamense]
MAVPRETAEDLRSRLCAWMNTTVFKPVSLNPLTGGQSNFTYLAHLKQRVKAQGNSGGDISEVIVKHGEPYMARHPSNAITTDRCSVEAACLKHLHALKPLHQTSQSARYRVGTPECYLYDDKTKIQIQEYLPGTLDLKSIVLKSCEEPLTVLLKQHYLHIGRALAEYISQFHQNTSPVARVHAEEGTSPHLSTLHEAIRRSSEMQDLKLMVNYDWLLERVEQFPDILKDAKDVFVRLREQGIDELKNGSAAPTVIHGDFCPQNILIRDESPRDGKETGLFVVDWENAQIGVPAMDHGEMIGELYSTWLYDGSDAGIHVIEGYAAGLGSLPVDVALRIAAQVGVHLLSFGTLAQDKSELQIDHVAREGRDIIVNSCKKNQSWFRDHVLRCLFTR